MKSHTPKPRLNEAIETHIQLFQRDLTLFCLARVIVMKEALDKVIKEEAKETKK